MKMQFKVVVTSGPDSGRAFAITADEEFWVGRGVQSTTRLGDPSVSRLHCRLDVIGGQLRVIDHSSSGTLLNGMAVEEAIAEAGDKIIVGETALQLVVVDAAEAKTTPPATRQSRVREDRVPVSSFPRDAQQQQTLNSHSEPDHRPELESDTTVPIDPVKRTRDLRFLQRLVGETALHYRIEQELARGRTGTVFRAIDTNSRAPVALKVLWPHITKNEGERERFIRAMQTTLPIEHENIVRVVNAATIKLAGSHTTLCWYAMEFIDGYNLRTIAAKNGVAGMLGWKNVWRVGVQMAKALQVAYEHRVIHRSITPENILMPRKERIAKLGDLTLAKALEGTQGEEITRRGELVGEVAYMSPERTRGEPCDHRSDMFSLGVTLYEVLCGRKPFEASKLPDLISEIQTSEPLSPRLLEMSIDEKFEGIILKLLAKSPSNRFDTPTSLMKELTSVGRYAGLIRH